MNDAKELLEKYKAGQCTPNELALLQKWFHHLNELEPSKLTDEELIEARLAFHQNMESLLNRQKSSVFWPRWAAAASIIFMLSFGGYLLYHRGHSEHNNANQAQFARNDVPPGRNSATLTLANGKRIVLSDKVKGQIAKEAGVSITKTANGQVVYTIADNNAAKVSETNTLSTAKGETYKINLPDGTQVWLNAASSLTYPARFTGVNRKVTLTGEGYFEVAKDKAHPFKVATSQQEVTVLGTHFNINAYTNETATRTTLLEGSVKLTAHNKETVIKPGQQVLFNNGRFKTLHIDTALATAWKNSSFMFDGEQIDYVMRMVERWYNVEVIYNGPVSTEKLYGSVSRYENVSEVLKTMESSGKIHFKVDGRKIIVTN